MLSQQSVAKLDCFFSQFKPLSYNRRTIINPAYDLPSSVFYIKKGYLRVFRISDHGEELTLTILKPKDFFPFTYSIAELDSAKTYYFEAITRLKIWKVNSLKFNKFVKDNTDISADLTNQAFIKLNEAISKMEDLVFNNAYTNILATIISCAKKFGEAQGVKIILNVPLTHNDIATLVGITRETTSLEMKKLEKQGYISRIGKYILIKNISQLEDEFMLQTGTKNLSPLSPHFTS